MAKATVHLQLDVVVNKAAHTLATVKPNIWPTVTSSMVAVTSMPRYSGGAISTMYKGTVVLEAPTAAPRMERPKIAKGTVEAVAWMKEPKEKRRLAQRSTFFRPIRSARLEAIGEAKKASNDVDDVIMDLSREVRARLDSEVPIETRAEAVTAVSSGKVVSFDVELIDSTYIQPADSQCPR